MLTYSEVFGIIDDAEHLDDAKQNLIRMTKEKVCENCKWINGKYTQTGIGSTYPCESCRIDNFEPKEKS